MAKPCMPVPQHQICFSFATKMAFPSSCNLWCAQYLNERVPRFLKPGEPVISGNTKKKELIGSITTKADGFVSAPESPCRR